MELFNNKRVMDNVEQAIAVMGMACKDAGVEWKDGQKFSVKDLLAMYVKYPQIFPTTMRKDVKEFYDMFCTEVNKDIIAGKR